MSSQHLDSSGLHRRPPSFQLSSLPEIPLLRTLRFLDERSLETMRQTCRWLNEVITHNRKNLISRSVYVVEIERIVDEHLKMSYYVELHLNEKSNYRWELPLSTPLFLWLANALPNCCITNLRLDKCRFDEMFLDGVEQAMKEKKFRIESIELAQTDFDSSTFRFLNTMKPQYIAFFDKRPYIHSTVFLSKDFLVFMSSLRYILIQTATDFMESPQFMRLPDHIPMEYSSSIVSNGLNWYLLWMITHWCLDEQDGSCFWMSIPENGDVENPMDFTEAILNVKDLAKHLHVPYEIVRHDARDKLVIRNLGGKKIYAYPMRETSQLRWRTGMLEWCIEADVCVDGEY